MQCPCNCLLNSQLNSPQKVHVFLAEKNVHAINVFCSFIVAAASLSVVQGSTEQLGKVVDSLKQLYGLRYIYCWHGLSCYWSGVSPYEKELEKYNARLVFSEVCCRLLRGSMSPSKCHFLNAVHGWKGIFTLQHCISNCALRFGSKYLGMCLLSCVWSLIRVHVSKHSRLR